MTTSYHIPDVMTAAPAPDTAALVTDRLHGKSTGLLALVRSDLARFTENYRRRGQPYSRLKVAFESLIFKANFQAVLLYRISHWFFQHGLIYPAWFLARLNQALTGADIEFNVAIGEGFFIGHASGIVIGRGTVIGAQATLYQGVTFGLREYQPGSSREFPHVGDRCFFFAHAVILGGVTIGDDCLVAAQALVNRDIPSGHVAKGVPARHSPIQPAPVPRQL